MTEPMTYAQLFSFWYGAMALLTLILVLVARLVMYKRCAGADFVSAVILALIWPATLVVLIGDAIAHVWHSFKRY